jgi:hypothetical protein
MPENVDESLLPHLSVFDCIKHLDPDGRGWWTVRELMLLLTYSKWQDFHKVIGAASEVRTSMLSLWQNYLDPILSESRRYTT